MPTDTPMVLVPRERLSLRTIHLVRPGDVLRAVRSFTNPEILTKGDHVIVESVGEGGNIVFTNLYRPTIQCGLRPERFEFVSRPVTRLSAVYSAPSTTSTAEQVGAALAPYLEDLKGIREEMAKPDAPTPGEGDAPVAWQGPGEKPHDYFPDIMAMGDCMVCGHTYDAHPPENGGPRTRPTPATPEGLREKVARMVELAIERHGVSPGDLEGTLDDADAILAALQPQAQPAALSPETDR